jgi:RNA polymerase sigma factor (sigma-70 family)
VSGFDTTRWSLVRGSRGEGDVARAALSELLRLYRGAILAYLRQRGFDAPRAEDLTQGFLLHFVEHDLHRRAEPELGGFRPLLLTALRNFVANELAAERAQKRGGGLDALALEDIDPCAPDADPERAFDRAWALALLRDALRRLQEEANAAGRSALLAELKPFLLEAPDPHDYAAAAARLGMRRNTLAAAVKRLRGRLQALVREALTDTVGSQAALEDEAKRLRGLRLD